MISIIVAVADNWGIGKENKLLWHLPEDLKRFKRLTTGKTVIMGKKTWESLPKRPLAGRKNVVLSDIKGEIIDGAVMAYSVNDVAEMCTKDEAFIIGGGSIYRQFMPLADRLYITHIHSKADADVFFPEIDPETWQAIHKESFPATGSTPAYSYVTYEKKNKKRSDLQ